MYVDYKFMKIKKRLKILWAGGIENGFGYTVHRTLKSYLKKWVDGMNWFAHADTNPWKPKVSGVGMVKNWYSLLGYWSLKSAVSQEWIGELSWFWLDH